VAEAYASNPILRAAAQLIPYAGPSIDAILGTFGGNLGQRRLQALFEELRVMMSQLEEEKVDKAFIEGEEWIDLLIQAIAASIRTRSRDKIRWYAAILAGAARVDRPPDLDLEGALAVLASLSPAEVQFARYLFDHSNAGQQLVKKTAISREADQEFRLRRLEATGLISEVIATYAGVSGGEFMVTPTFTRIMKLVSSVVKEGLGESLKAL